MTDKEKGKKETQATENPTGSAYIGNGRIHVFNKRVKDLLDEVIKEDVNLKED